MTAAGVPEALRTYRTKQELALDLIERALQNGVQFSWVGFDGFYGDNGQFLRMLDGTGLTFLGDVHCDQYIWTADPLADTNAKRMRADAWAAAQGADAWGQSEMRHGAKGARGGEAGPGADANAKRGRADAWAAAQGADAWRQIEMRHGTKGPMEVECLHGRVWLDQRGDEHAYEWHLIATRQPNRLKYSLSNAAPDTPIERLAYMQGQRYFVERALE